MVNKVLNPLMTDALQNVNAMVSWLAAFSRCCCALNCCQGVCIITLVVAFIQFLPPSAAFQLVQLPAALPDDPFKHALHSLFLAAIARHHTLPALPPVLVVHRHGFLPQTPVPGSSSSNKTVSTQIVANKQTYTQRVQAHGQHSVRVRPATRVPKQQCSWLWHKMWGRSRQHTARLGEECDRPLRAVKHGMMSLHATYSSTMSFSIPRLQQGSKVM